MFFSKSCEYGLRATLFLAQRKDGEKIGISVIANALAIPESYLSKVMQLLVKDNIVSSTKGRNGGFYLSKNELNEPLVRIVHAIDGIDVFKKCGLGIKDCSSKKPCPLHNDIKAYRDNLRLALSENSIYSMRDDLNEGNTFLMR